MTEKGHMTHPRYLDFDMLDPLVPTQSHNHSLDQEHQDPLQIADETKAMRTSRAVFSGKCDQEIKAAPPPTHIRRGRESSISTYLFGNG